MRSGVLFLACSYSRRASLAVSGSLALVAGGLFPSPLGFGLGGFFLARLVCLVPARGLPCIGKVCWSKILLGDCAGIDPLIITVLKVTWRFPRPRGDRPIASVMVNDEDEVPPPTRG